MRRAVATSVLILLAGCAAIFGSKQKNFDLRSNPDGAEVFLDGARLGTTPFKVNLSNQKEHAFVFRKEGFKEVTCTLSKGTGGGWVVADILLGLVPVIIDAATSSWSQTQGDSCMASFEPVAPSVSAAPAAAPRPATADAVRTPASQPAPTEQAAPTAPTPPTASPDTVRAVVGYSQLPPGTNYVGDARIRVYYPLGCAAQHAIPADFQVFFQTADGATRDGFVASGDC
ncbi:MAG: PEGA domain-containing protein [Gemmatimonadales bacterium]